jgi:hypothetical protein
MRKLGIVLCVLLLATAAVAQTRTRRSVSTTQKRRTPAETAATVDGSPVRTEAATKVANQIKNLSAFLYLLGGVAKRIEEIDAAAKTDPNSSAAQQNEQNKARLKSSFADFRAGLDQLEIYFRSTPGLQSYYLKLAGSAEGAAAAENLAASGRFDQAGRALLGVVNRLADTLVSMRQA